MSFPPALMPAWPDEHTASLSHGTDRGPEGCQPPVRDKGTGLGPGDEGILLGLFGEVLAFPGLSGSTKVQVLQRCVSPVV